MADQYLSMPGPSKRRDKGRRSGGKAANASAGAADLEPEEVADSEDDDHVPEPTPKLEDIDPMDVDTVPRDGADPDVEAPSDDEVEEEVMMDEEEDDDAEMLASIARRETAAAAAAAGLDELLAGAGPAGGDGGLTAAMRASLGLGGGHGGILGTGVPGGMSARLRNLLTSLKQRDGDPSLKLIALQELSELLSISTEDTLAGYFSPDQFSRELIGIVKGGAGDMDGFAVEQDSVEMMVLATRCLANMMEALPGSAHSVVHAGAVPVLCAKLLEIQFIDLAEQTLEKISEEMPAPIVREGGLTAILGFLDFFSTNVQRTAVSAAANCCRGLPADTFQLVRDVVPILRNVLGYSDQRTVESACIAIVRMVDSFRHHPDKLDKLLDSESIAAVLNLLVPGTALIGPAVYTQILRMLAHAARASPEVAVALLDKDIAATLYLILVGIAAPGDDGDEVDAIRKQHDEDDMLVLSNLVHRPKDQVQEALSLATELMPTLPRDGVFSSKPGKADRKVKVKQEEDATVLMAPVASASSSNAAQTEDDDAPAVGVKAESASPGLPAPAVFAPIAGSSSAAASTRQAANDRRAQHVTGSDMSEERVRTIVRFHTLMLPTLIDVYSASVGVQVRTKALLGMAKSIQFCPDDALDRILTVVPMASFLGTLVAGRDQPALLTGGLQLVELLLIKKPDTYHFFFRREGVLHEIERLADGSLVAPPKPSTSKKGSRGSMTSLNADVETGADLGTRAPIPPLDQTPSGLSRALREGGDVLAAALAMQPDLAPPPASGISIPDAQAKDANTLRARHIRDKYARADTDSSRRAAADLDELRGLAGQLSTAADEANMLLALQQVAGLFSTAERSTSSFEMLESGLVGSLLRFANDCSDQLDTPTRRRLLWKAFNASTSALPNLVKRLQESMSRLEDFAIVTAQVNSTDDSRRSSTSMLARQLKLRLIGEGTDIPRTCSNVIVSIHAIATFQAFNDYLRPRILTAQNPAAGERAAYSAPVGGVSSGGVSGALAAFAAAAGIGDLGGPAAGPSSSAAASRLSQSLRAAAGMPPVASTSSAPASARKASPVRRRSSRLSAKSAPSLQAAGDEKPAPLQDDDDDDRGDACLDDGMDDDIFAGEFDPPVPPPDEEDRPVNLKVAADGSKVEASTPEGTRVGTPKLHKPASFADRPASRTPTPLAGSSSGRPASPAPRTSGGSYAAAVKKEPTDFHLQFELDGLEVPLDTTIYGAVYAAELRATNSAPTATRSLWTSIHTVKFRKVPGPAPVSPSPRSTPEPSSSAALIAARMPSLGPESIAPESKLAQMIQLLRVIHVLNADPPVDLLDNEPGAWSSGKVLNEQAFINNKLSSKLNRQLEEPMIVASGCLPEWALELPQSYPFLFPFTTRHNFLQSTSFGYARLLNKWTSAGTGPNAGGGGGNSNRRDESLGFLGRLTRQKVRISRARMLESAVKIFELYSGAKSALEIEYFDECGTGLGPTLEFFSLVSREFQRKDLGMWREGDGDSGNPSAFVFNPCGLFPAPLSSADAESERGGKVLLMFRVLGQFIAKSLMDSRIVDLPFNREFMRLVIDGSRDIAAPPSLATIRHIDRMLARSLEHIVGIQSDEELAALDVDFTLPGTSIPLKEGGADLAVTRDNVAEYIRLVCEYTVRQGVSQQVRAFREGFSAVFSVRDLRTFTPDELVVLFGNVSEDWSRETLSEHIRADHGFTSESRSVRNLIEIISAFDDDARRQFLQFITGSPKLPVGGFAALNPKLTIVRRGTGAEADSLPSVMTCVCVDDGVVRC